MKSALVLTLVLLGTTASAQPNTLTEAERADGWRLLFDGETGAGWRGIYQDTFPSTGWQIEDGVLTVLGKRLAGGGGAIITEEQFGDFELRLEFKYETGANSGIKYTVLERDPPTPGHGLGLEYQIWDDTQPREPYHKLAALYELIVPENKPVRPVGEWNEARVVVRGDSAEHWLNGVRVVAYDRRTSDFRARVDESKYHVIENFGLEPRGHILLQDEGSPQVSFRNIKIRTF